MASNRKAKRLWHSVAQRSPHPRRSWHPRFARWGSSKSQLGLLGLLVRPGCLLYSNLWSPHGLFKVKAQNYGAGTSWKQLMLHWLNHYSQPLENIMISQGALFGDVQQRSSDLTPQISSKSKNSWVFVSIFVPNSKTSWHYTSAIFKHNVSPGK